MNGEDLIAMDEKKNIEEESGDENKDFVAQYKKMFPDEEENGDENKDFVAQYKKMFPDEEVKAESGEGEEEEGLLGKADRFLSGTGKEMTKFAAETVAGPVIGKLAGEATAWMQEKLNEDPTGEHGALAYLGLNMASGLGTAAGKVVGGFAKGVTNLAGMAAAGTARLGETVFNALTDSNWHGASDAIAGATQWLDKAIDFITPDVFELRGMYEGIEGAKEVNGAIGEVAGMAASLGGIGAVGKGARALALARGANAAKAGKVAAQTTGTMFGLQGYEGMAADPNGVAADREGGFWSGGNWLQEISAMGGGLAEGTIFGMFGPVTRKLEGAKDLQPFLERTKMQVLGTFLKETARSGGAMAAAEASKQAIMGYAGAAAGTPWMVETGKVVTLPDGRQIPEMAAQTFESAAKSTMSQFMVGSAFHLAGLGAKISEYRNWRGRKNAQGEIETGPSDKMMAAMTFRVEQNRKAYCPMMDAQARTAAALMANGRTVQAGGVGCEYVEQVLAGGEVKFKDGSVWRPGRPYALVTGNGEKVMKAGRATITVSDGTVLDAETGALVGYAPKGTEWRTPAEAEYLKGRKGEGETDAQRRQRIWELGGNDQTWYMERPEDVALAEENNFDKNATGELSAEGTA